MKIVIKKYEFALVSLTFLAIWLYIFLFSGIMTSGLDYLVNDHAIYEDHVNKFDFLTILQQSFIDNYFSEPTVQRFRPFYNFLQRLSPYVFGYNPLPYYFSSFLIGASTSIGLYLFAKRINFSSVSSFLFASTVVFGPQSSAYSYAFPIPAEASATLFVVIALILSTQISFEKSSKNLVISITVLFFGILGSLTKESYILMIPALVFFNIDYYSQNYSVSYIESFKKNKIITTVFTIFFLIVIYFLKTKVTGQGYAGIDDSTFSVINIYSLIKYLYTESILGLTITFYLIFVIYNLIKKSFTITNSFFRFTLFNILIFVPQLFLYVKSGIVGNTHYLFPLIIGLSLFTIKPVDELKYKNIYLHFILSLIIFISLIKQVHNAEKYFKNKALYLRDLHSMVYDLSTCLKNKNSKLIVFGNPYVELEPLPAFRGVVLRRLLEVKSENIYLATVGSMDSDFFSKAYSDFEHNLYKILGSQDKHMKAEFNNKLVKNLSIGNKQEIDAIVIFNYPQYKKDFFNENADWFVVKNYRLKQYPYADHGFYCRLK
jgi:hypothetical protein